MDLAKEWNALVLPEAFEIVSDQRCYELALSVKEYDFFRDSLLRFLHISKIFPAKNATKNL